jgi:benzoyl-CoA reductase/2-hydroxyglutaryl-CoA dehydratase subunit BcrC/BadD/HgdB
MKKALYRSPFIPAEWITAHGFEPDRLIPSSLSTDGPIPDTEGVCPFMRSFVNEASQSNASIIILTTMCDQMRHAHNLLQQSTDKKTFLFNLPSTWQTPASINLYITELKRLGRFLVDNGGGNPTDEELAEIMLKNDQARTCMPKTPTVTPGKTPIAILGGGMSSADKEILNLISDLGGQVVLDGTESGERTMPAPFNEQRVQENPIAELAEAYFNTIPDAFRRPNSELFRWLKEKTAERQPRGIIFLRQVWCDIWHAEVQRLKECTDIPLLDIDLNGEDPIPRNKTRVEAFMETIR